MMNSNKFSDINNFRDINNILKLNFISLTRVYMDSRVCVCNLVF